MERYMMIPRNVIKGLTSNPLRFDKIEVIQRTKQYVTEEFKEIERGSYKGHRFSNTSVKFRPKWNDAESCYGLGDLNKDKERLENLVEECSFIYETGPKKEEVIEKCNPRNRRDPFLRDIRLHLRAEEGFYIFKPNNAIDIIMLEALKDDNRVAFTDDTSTMTKETQFFIVSVDYETNKRIKEISKKKEMFQMYYSLDSYTKRQIANILGESIDVNTSDDYVDSILFDMIDNPTKVDGVLSSKRLHDVMKLKPDVIKLKEVIALSRKHMIYDKEGNIFYLSGNALGTTMEEIENYFSNYENKELYGFLKKKLKKELNQKYELSEVSEVVSVKDSNKRKPKKKDSSSDMELSRLENNKDEEE